MLTLNKEKIYKSILSVILVISILIVGSVIGEIIFNVGQQLGTFLRGIYKIVVC